MKQYRHRRSSNPSNPFPSPLEPGEIAVNTANRQLAVGNADAAALGVPLPLIAIRYFDTHASYLANDMVVQAGKLYVAIAAVPPGPFNASQWTEFTGSGGGGGPAGDFLPLTGGTLTGPLGIGPVSIFPGAMFEAGDKDSGTFTVAPLWVDMTTFNGVNAYDAAAVYFGRTRGPSTAPAPVHTNDMLGGIWWNANEGGDWASGAGLSGIVDGPVAVGSLPTALVFYTGDKDSGIERLRIASDGKITATGDLTISKNRPAITLSKTSAVQDVAFGSALNGLSRWIINFANASAETGGNVGSDFTLGRYSDAGAFIDDVLTVVRSTGEVIVAKAPTNPSGVARKAEVDAKVTKTGDTMTGDLVISKARPAIVFDRAAAANGAIIDAKVAGVYRWTLNIGNNVAETGGNAGSDFTIARYSDLGVVLDVPLSISRASGLVTLAADPTAPLGVATKQYVDAGVRALNNISATAYTLVLTDTGKLLSVFNGPSNAVVITVPTNAVVAFPFGAQIDIASSIANTVTIAPSSGVTINSEDSKRRLPKMGSCATLVKISTDVWLLTGSLIA